MSLKFYKFPVEHIVIDGLLGEEDYKKIKQELHNLYHAMYEGEYYDDDGKLDDQRAIKRCLNLNLNAHYQEQIDLSYLEQTVINKYIYSNQAREFYDNCGTGSCFSLMNDTDSSYSLLAGFQDGDFYDFHGDLGITTVNIMLSNNPSIKGGNFILTNQVARPSSKRVIGEKLESITYEYKAGRAIVFPSRFKHKVTSVNCESNSIDDVRFTLQHRSWVQNI